MMSRLGELRAFNLPNRCSIDEVGSGSVSLVLATTDADILEWIRDNEIGCVVAMYVEPRRNTVIVLGDLGHLDLGLQTENRRIIVAISCLEPSNNAAIWINAAAAAATSTSDPSRQWRERDTLHTVLNFFESLS
jgi:hypothetical protein